MANERIKDAAKAAGVRLWMCAEVMGITDSMLSRKLRRELDSKEQEKILAIIAEIAREKEAEENEQDKGN